VIVGGGIMDRRNFQYQIPELSDLNLGVVLSNRIKKVWNEARENSFEIYLYAAGLRNHYLDPATHSYSAEFIAWYAKHELEQLFGKLSSFSKYASAGDMVNHFGQHYRSGKYINQLPISRNALYELSMLVDETTDTQLEKFFHSGGTDNDPLIHPSATAGDISAYRKGSSANISANTKTRKSRFTIPLATIYVSKDLYQFNRTTGAHSGSVDLSDVEKALNRLNAGVDTKIFDVRDNLERITSTYRRSEQRASPSSSLRAKSKRKRR
jgi:hypothetical protein